MIENLMSIIGLLMIVFGIEVMITRELSGKIKLNKIVYRLATVNFILGILSLFLAYYSNGFPKIDAIWNIFYNKIDLVWLTLINFIISLISAHANENWQKEMLAKELAEHIKWLREDTK